MKITKIVATLEDGTEIVLFPVVPEQTPAPEPEVEA
jgi:hypothetical protein